MPARSLPSTSRATASNSSRVQGGGIVGQASAARTAVARGLLLWLKDDSLREMFRHYDRSLVVNDPRRKLPKRPGGRGATQRRQKSYR